MNRVKAGGKLKTNQKLVPVESAIYQYPLFHKYTNVLLPVFVLLMEDLNDNSPKEHHTFNCTVIGKTY